MLSSTRYTVIWRLMVVDGLSFKEDNGSVGFNHNWVDYEKGFGNLIAEVWLGLGKIHCLINISSPNTLQVDLDSFKEGKPFANYSSFTIGIECNELYSNSFYRIIHVMLQIE